MARVNVPKRNGRQTRISFLTSARASAKSCHVQNSSKTKIIAKIIMLNANANPTIEYQPKNLAFFMTRGEQER